MLDVNVIASWPSSEYCIIGYEAERNYPDVTVPGDNDLRNR